MLKQCKTLLWQNLAKFASKYKSLKTGLKKKVVKFKLLPFNFLSWISWIEGSVMAGSTPWNRIAIQTNTQRSTTTFFFFRRVHILMLLLLLLLLFQNHLKVIFNFIFLHGKSFFTNITTLRFSSWIMVVTVVVVVVVLKVTTMSFLTQSYLQQPQHWFSTLLLYFY